MNTKWKPLLLVAEDNPDEWELLNRVLEEGQYASAVIHVWNGAEAVAYLESAKAVLPDLMFLDLKMPRMGGIDLLRWLHGQPHLAHVPKVVLTNTGDAIERAECYRLGAAAFVTKPLDIAALQVAVLRLFDRLAHAPRARLKAADDDFRLASEPEKGA